MTVRLETMTLDLTPGTLYFRRVTNGQVQLVGPYHIVGTVRDCESRQEHVLFQAETGGLIQLATMAFFATHFEMVSQGE